MKKALAIIAIIGAAGLMAGCNALGCGGCEPDPCCEPVYVSPCCPAPSGGIAGTPSGAAPAADAGAGNGGGGSCGQGCG